MSGSSSNSSSSSDSNLSIRNDSINIEEKHGYGRRLTHNDETRNKENQPTQISTVSQPIVDYDSTTDTINEKSDEDLDKNNVCCCLEAEFIIVVIC